MSTTKLYQRSVVSRSFQFVPYASPSASEIVATFAKNSPTITCDGRVAGSCTLELSHWNGNATPDKYYADTSTEMALKLPIDMLTDAVVMNNHYDTDGVLSVYACLDPIQALEHEALLVSAAAAGDFSEWISNAGIQLDAVLTSMSSDGDEQDTYQRALQELPNILQDFAQNSGQSYRHAWEETYNDAVESYECIQSGQARLEMINGIVILYEPPTKSTCISPFALHRAMVEQQEQATGGGNLWQSATRVLRVVQRQDRDSNVFQYVYEKPGHGWVHKLKTRRPIPPVADFDTLLAGLNQASRGQEEIQNDIYCWKKGGPSDLISICCTSRDIAMPPNEVAALLCQLDEGAAVSV